MGDMSFPDPIESPHKKWEWDGDKWAIPEKFTVPEATFTAFGDIDLGEMVVVNADGTVTGVWQTSSPGNIVEGVFGDDEGYQFDPKARYFSTTYDPVAQKVVITFKAESNQDYGSAVVATLTDGVLTYGPTVVFNPSETEYPTSIYHPVANKMIVVYNDVSNNAGAAVVGTVSGDSISFGTPASLGSLGEAHWVEGAYHAGDNKIVIVYRDMGNSQYGTAVVGTVSGNSISFGARIVFNSAQSGWPFPVYDPVANKLVIVYGSDGFGGTGEAVVATLNGDNLTFGTPTVFRQGEANTYFSRAIYDSVNNKIILTYVETESYTDRPGRALVGTVSGNSITFGETFTFSWGKVGNPSGFLEPTTNKLVVIYQDAYNNLKGTAIEGTISGDSIVFDYPTVFGEYGISDPGAITYDSVNKRVVFAYGEGSSKGVANHYFFSYQEPNILDTNLSEENFIGVSMGDYIDGSEARVQIAGINADQENMAVGLQYVQPDGTLSSTEGSPSVLAGTATSSTNINVKDLV